MNLALWLKRNGYRADQVQTFLPSPMAAGHRDVSHRPQSAAPDAAQAASEAVSRQGPEAAPPAQGLPALSRCRRTGRCCARR